MKERLTHCVGLKQWNFVFSKAAHENYPYSSKHGEF